MDSPISRRFTECTLVNRISMQKGDVMSALPKGVIVDDQPGGVATRELYVAKTTANGIDGLDAVTDDHIELFREQGFLVVNNAFSPDEVSSAIEGMVHLIGGGNPDFKGVQFETSGVEKIDAVSGEERQDLVRKLMWFVEYDARLKALSAKPELLEVVSRIVQGEPEMFQDMALLKPPFIGREKPWHQDNAFFNLPITATITGAWIALDEALPENGCMYVIPASHNRGPVVHFKRRDWQICDTDVAVDEAVAVPLKPGGVLFFHGLLHHGTPPSNSPRRRRALQFHYKAKELEWAPEEDRLRIFGSEGKDVQC
jgi:phytanoyl-CoA hydroxylase